MLLLTGKPMPGQPVKVIVASFGCLTAILAVLCSKVGEKQFHCSSLILADDSPGT